MYDKRSVLLRSGQAQGTVVRSSAFRVHASLYSLLFSSYLSSIGGMTHTMAIAVQQHYSAKEEISHAHGGCTCNPCTCDPCTCGSTVASVKEEISHAHGGCTCNPCTCDPCTCGSTVASVVEEVPVAHGGCTCNPCTCDPCTCG
jgi:hypothetical protein